MRIERHDILGRELARFQIAIANYAPVAPDPLSNNDLAHRKAAICTLLFLRPRHAWGRLQERHADLRRLSPDKPAGTGRRADNRKVEEIGNSDRTDHFEGGAMFGNVANRAVDRRAPALERNLRSFEDAPARRCSVRLDRLFHGRAIGEHDLLTRLLLRRLPLIRMDGEPARRDCMARISGVNA
jgi:hypothetical protein